MPLDAATRQRIDDVLSNNRIVLFMKGSPQAPQCGFSAKAVAALNDLDTAFAHVDVLADPAIREGIKQYGDWPTIPQLYIDHELIGGSDIVEQMVHSGELHAALGLQPPDRTPPRIELTSAAVAMLRQAIADAGSEVVVEIGVDSNFRTRLNLAQRDTRAITLRVDGIPMQLDPPSAKRAQGLRIDWADDARGRGLVVDNPNAPASVHTLSATQAAERVAAGTVTIVDVRPREERARAAINAPYLHLDDGVEPLQVLAADTRLAFLCHHGGRSQQAAEHFLQLGFRQVYNIDGGIDAWSAQVDPSVPRYE